MFKVIYWGGRVPLVPPGISAYGWIRLDKQPSHTTTLA